VLHLCFQSYLTDKVGAWVGKVCLNYCPRPP